MLANFKEPEPNNDPNYIPTPPKVAKAEVSISGEAILRFTEDVWVVDNLKTATV